MSPKLEQGIWKYGSRLPGVSEDCRITLGEGRTPLVPSAGIGHDIGLESLYFKLEALNPTGSYKDRISALGVSLAKESGKTGCIGTTSGNAGASIAAYAARAGLKYQVFVQENIVPSKLEQVRIHRASITRVRGFGFDPAIGERVFHHVLRTAEAHNRQLMVTAYAYAPEAMEAVKTIAYEIAEAMPEGGPDAVFVPVGGGGLLSGIACGFAELREEGSFGGMPRMAACQSAGCANVAKAWRLGLSEPVPGPSVSRISGIQVPNPPDAGLVLGHLAQSNGFAEAVEDEQTWYWQERLAEREGIFCEPAGAIALAGVVQALREGRIDKRAKVVCIVSGAGYKDAERMGAMASAAPDIPCLSVDELEMGAEMEI
ncbi:threonine synthase [Paenibacillus sp. UNCCL117]|uniref:pyridoxal-phosphate dependent enzyme n=1 Tax=unclassified Paenibacillus TaxID=185978 RepID=UPI00089138C7|nr:MULTISPECIES: pyridoxal-phosphate dependent enzyme [unclassified Paenibacillus]SDD24410.1 threonine synthase [Paenibacillus sp. cl123]SFW41492.1 threonine synthase [Paenibacillus sp. UNCCL117]